MAARQAASIVCWMILDSSLASAGIPLQGMIFEICFTCIQVLMGILTFAAAFRPKLLSRRHQIFSFTPIISLGKTTSFPVR